VRLRGRVVYRDLEGGVWVLEGEDGQRYQLAGGDRRIKRDGAAIEAEGEVEGEALTAAMVGPLFRVRTYRFL
jgi:hypothetical protein